MTASHGDVSEANGRNEITIANDQTNNAMTLTQVGPVSPRDDARFMLCVSLG